MSSATVSFEMTNLTAFEHINHHNDITVINPNEIVFYILHIKTMNLLLQVFILWDFNKFYSVFNIWNEFTALSVGFGVFWRIADILCLPCFCLPFTLISFQDFKNTASYCKIPHQALRCLMLVTGIAYSLQLCLITSSHVKIVGCGYAHGLLHWNPLSAPWLVRSIIFHQLMQIC